MLPLVLALFITAVDQLTKLHIRHTYALGESRPVLEGFFSFTYVRNTGAAWGLFGGQNTALAALSVIMLLVLFFCRRSFLTGSLEHRVALGLMVGGILGNLVDRVKLGWVTDFLDFYWGGHHFPAFNVADAAICTGVALYLLSAFWLKRHPLQEDVPGRGVEQAPQP